MLAVLLLPTGDVETGRHDVRRPPPLDEILLHRNRKVSVGGLDEVHRQPEARRDVLDPPPAVGEGVLPAVTGEAVAVDAPAAPGSDAAGPKGFGAGWADPLPHHGGLAAGALHEFDGGDDGVLLDDDGAGCADGCSRCFVAFNFG